MAIPSIKLNDGSSIPLIAWGNVRPLPLPRPPLLPLDVTSTRGRRILFEAARTLQHRQRSSSAARVTTRGSCGCQSPES